MPSQREQLSNRIADFLRGYSHTFSNVQQALTPRDDGGPGGARSVTFRAREVDHTLMIWKENRLDMNTSDNLPSTWTRFDSEEQFYAYCRTVFNLQGPIRK